MNGYDIIYNNKIDDHITFIRINPTDIKVTLREIFNSISNIAWISSFDEDYIKDGFKVRAEATIDYISKNIIRSNEDEVTKNSGECLVSELARKTVVSEMKYLDIPLGELIKEKDFGNHGFDFFSKNNDNILLFGEAKYVAAQNAYGKALKQIVKFIGKKDKSDVIAIDKFCCEDSKRNFASGNKGFMAAFAAKSTSTKKIIKGIQENTDFQELIKYNELICIAVNI
ncbi:hypothetical protein [Tenacibaculum caenipelagi]|uniref:Anti-bacteriophage protein A/HamA C-terminal domain-containing protein n=1 Tax=Tenacibaculum caenipelagi TaxID=1325435 RepID=A0A4R6TB68_9FLAO|nr:hypothetical protein [Tenacibaculum caenipelagi]TDQ23888.1 hypothetical protein DFQ07_2420 [Tenacibaculum caenipelagi]